MAVPTASTILTDSVVDGVREVGVEDAGGIVDGEGVIGSCLISAAKETGTGGGTCGRGGFAGAFPLAFALGISSKMNWLPTPMLGLGVVGTGGLRNPALLVELLPPILFRLVVLVAVL